MSNMNSIELTVGEPANLCRKAFPLTVGVPFARGVLAANEPVAFTDQAGQPVPLQSRVMETHDDGSVRWLLLDYQADCEPLTDSTHRLWLGKKPEEAEQGCRIRTEEKGDILIVENGVLKVEIDRNRCCPLLRVWHEEQLISDGELSFRIGLDEEEKYFATNDSDISFGIEESGPLRLLMRWEGKHKDDCGRGHFDFLVRMTVYAGKPFVRIDHTFINRLDAPVTEVREVVARIPVTLGDGLRYSVGGSAVWKNIVQTERPVRLDTYHLGKFRIHTAEGEVLFERSNHNVSGWIDASGAARGVLVAGKNLWQNYPKSLSADAEALEYHLIPDRGGSFAVPRGMAKTHTFYLCFHNGGESDEQLQMLADSVQFWPMPAASPEDYLQSGEVWDFFGYYPEKYPRFEVAMRKFFEPDRTSHFPNPPTDRAYGLKHFGDYVTGRSVGINNSLMINGPDPDAADAYYLNNEYDTPHVLAMMFLRTRELAKWWGAQAHAQHMMDVDTCHHAVAAPPSEMLEDWRCLFNCQYRHCCQHVGGIQRPDETKHVPAEGSHTFAEGLIDLYHLTGDRRPLDVATDYALHLSYMVNDRGYRWGIKRGSGWGMLILGSVYKVRPLESIRRAAEALMDSMRTDTRVLSDRLANLALRGVVKWHQVTGDEQARQLILALTDRFLADCQSREGLFLSSPWPNASMHTTAIQGFANLEVLAYCYDLTGERRYIDEGIGMLCLAVDWINNPKYERGLIPWMRILRGPFRFMQITHELGLLEKVPGMGRWLNS